MFVQIAYNVLRVWLVADKTASTIEQVVKLAKIRKLSSRSLAPQ